MNKLLLMMFMILFLNACEWTERKICGGPTVEMQVFIASVNSSYADILKLRQVPCYPGYAQVNLKKDLRPEFIDSLVQEICGHSFVEVLVYDKEGKMIRGNSGSM